jgi:hypothetical protein
VTLGGITYPYGDREGRIAVDIQAYSLRHNLVGNVLGKQGETLLSVNNGTYSATQDAWVFESLSGFPSDNPVIMWNIGAYTASTTGNLSWVANTYQTQLRDGNWDWVTASQTWLGIGGTQASPNGTPQTIPDSLYTSKPAFFGSNTWPWVDPSTGTTYTLPAKARFDAGTPNG